MRHWVLSILSAAALLSSASLAAPIYKWQDAEGRVHYEDTRPPQGDVKVIKPPVVYRGEATEPTTPPPPAGDAITARAEERARKCAESRARLAEGQNADRMYALDERGNRTYLTEAEISSHVAKLQEAVDSWCKDE